MSKLISTLGVAGMIGLLTACASDPEPGAVSKTITGDAAEQLLALGYAREVLVGRMEQENKTVVAVIRIDPRSAGTDEFIDQLFSDEIPGCKTGGFYACCNPATKTRHLYTDSGDWEEAGRWIDLGELCTPYDSEHAPAIKPINTEAHVGPPNIPSSVELVSIPHDLSMKIYDETGIDSAFLEFPNSDGSTRMLYYAESAQADVDGVRSQGISDLFVQVGLNMPNIEFASHPVNGQQCGGPFDVCKSLSVDEKCREANGHYYFRKYANQQIWCRRATCCGANCKC